MKTMSIYVSDMTADYILVSCAQSRPNVERHMVSVWLSSGYFDSLLHWCLYKEAAWTFTHWPMGASGNRTWHPLVAAERASRAPSRYSSS